MKRRLCVLVLLAGCVSTPQLPPCAGVAMTILRTSDGAMYAFDAAQLTELIARMQEIQDGKCRMPGEEKES